MQITDYSMLALLNASAGPVFEAFNGADIVGWYGGIERQLTALESKYRSSRQDEQANKVAQFLKIWRENEITGSINIDTIKTLESASSLLAVETWKSQSYFSALHDQLRRLAASEEELPRLPDDSYANQPPSGKKAKPVGQFDGQEKEGQTTPPGSEATSEPAAPNTPQ